MKKIALLFFIAIMGQSCVSSKIHKDLQTKYKDLESENTSLRQQNDELSSRMEVAGSKLQSLEKDITALKADTAAQNQKMRELSAKYAALNKSYEFLMESNNALMATNEKENQALSKKLAETQKELQLKEDSLQTEQNRLDYLSKELQKREARVYELESLIARKDSTVNAVMKRVKDALLNFEGKGLTVETRDGKVYVSLENRLLFPSASWNVNAEGKKALDQLAVVLAENPDLNVMVEGHTDSDAFNGSTAVKDNWDLSVMRATSIVKIITSNKGVNPMKITAAGRSEYLPVATNDTPEGKAKNRRTEIVITPNLGELIEMLEEVK